MLEIKLKKYTDKITPKSHQGHDVNGSSDSPLLQYIVI